MFPAPQVILEFRNQYGYYIGNAVVPSLLMVFICYLTLFFDLLDFQVRERVVDIKTGEEKRTDKNTGKKKKKNSRKKYV